MILVAGASLTYLKITNKQSTDDNEAIEQWGNASQSNTTTNRQPAIGDTKLTTYNLQLKTDSPVIPYPEPQYQNPITLKAGDEEYILEFKENQTTYQFMQALYASSQKPFIFEAKEYPGMGMFVESINGIQNNPQKNLYWIYYVNGQSAKTGISNYIIKQKDKIEWKYENTNF